MQKEIICKGMGAKLEGWRKICRKYADSELYGYDGKTGTYAEGSIAQQFNIMLIAIEEILKKTEL